ncbi:flagellar hook-length control protein FliK, partial [bacterium]|nr:flagellar hook-length control protein FliK [bacterium]
FSKAEKTNVREIAGNLRIMLSAKKGEMTVNLAPEHLGKLEIKLKKNGDKMSGEFKVENKEAEEMLKSRFSELRETLENQGIKIDEFTVILKDEYSSTLSNSAGDGQARQQMGFERSWRNEVRVNKDVKINFPVGHPTGSNESGLNIYA